MNGWKYLASQNDSFTHWKVCTSTQQMYDFGFSRRFVLVRVWYLSSSEAYTNNWGLFGKENYLTFDWWKHFLKILRRSDVTINLTRLKKWKQVSSPLVVLYSWGFFSDAPSPCVYKTSKSTYDFSTVCIIHIPVMYFFK